MAHKKAALIIFIILIIAILSAIIAFYVLWKGSIHGFIIFGIGAWLLIYTMFFAGGNKK